MRAAAGGMRTAAAASRRHRDGMLCLPLTQRSLCNTRARYSKAIQHRGRLSSACGGGGCAAHASAPSWRRRRSAAPGAAARRCRGAQRSGRRGLGGALRGPRLHHHLQGRRGGQGRAGREGIMDRVMAPALLARRPPSALGAGREGAGALAGSLSQPREGATLMHPFCAGAGGSWGGACAAAGRRWVGDGHSTTDSTTAQHSTPHHHNHNHNQGSPPCR